jgi:hypothetical protein
LATEGTERQLGQLAEGEDHRARHADGGAVAAGGAQDLVLGEVIGVDDLDDLAADQLAVEGYDMLRGPNEGTTLKAESGFGARMAGFRTGKTYEALGDRTYFWTSTMRGSDVWRRKIAAATPGVFRFTNPPSTFAISVRCVGD